jgi:phage-related protein
MQIKETYIKDLKIINLNGDYRGFFVEKFR